MAELPSEKEGGAAMKILNDPGSIWKSVKN
jgi:hypothetical protein